MKHLIGGSKDQWPPVGKSSDTPKEVKYRKTGRNTTGIREASEYGAGCIYMHSAIPQYMKYRRAHSDLYKAVYFTGNTHADHIQYRNSFCRMFSYWNI